VSLDFHPFCRAGRGLLCKRAFWWLFNAVDGVRLQDANPIAGAEDGTDVMRVVHVFEDNRQIRLPPG
jgi:hypothetical protein